jgi:hypothetical protein
MIRSGEARPDRGSGIALQLRQGGRNRHRAELRRHAGDGAIDLQHTLVSEGPYLNSTNHLTARGRGLAIEARSQAIEWSYENKAERENAIVHAYERSKKEMARASSPGGRSFRDPTGADSAEAESPEAANQKRFEVLQGKRTAAMGGGRYIK